MQFQLANTLMNFEDLVLKDLMTGIYRFIPSLSIVLFWLWQYSLYCVTQWAKEIKIHSVETVSEVSQKSNVKIVTYEKRDQKIKRNKKRRAPK